MNPKEIIKRIIISILRRQARAVIKKHAPRIVAVTGSVGKSSTKEAVAAVLGTKFSVRKSPKSYNSAFGVPLTVLGLETSWNAPIGWFIVLIRGFFVRFAADYPAVLVVEAGVDRPGDMDGILSTITPHSGVVTAIGEIPVHVEFFSGPKEIAFEKGKLVRRVAADGHVIINADDEIVYDMRSEARGKIITFGFGKGADIRVTNYMITTTRTDAGKEIPEGIRCKVDYRDAVVPLHIPGVFGKQQLYIAAAAIGVGVSFGLNLVDSISALASYKPLPGRMRLLEGVKGSYIVDDTYNASPMAMHAALDTLRDLPARRRIAVLGDMLEIGTFTIQAHQAIGELAVPIVDMLFTVGPRAKFIAREAKERGMKADHVHECGSAAEAGALLQNMLEEGDIVVIKGSQSMRMERAVEEVMAHPEQQKELLCRQEEYWQAKA